MQITFSKSIEDMVIFVLSVFMFIVYMCVHICIYICVPYM